MFIYFFPVTFQAKFLLLLEAGMALLGLLGPLIGVTAFTGNIAHAAHLGGMLTGIFYIRRAGGMSRSFEFWRPFARRNPPPKRELVGAVTPRRAWRNAQKADGRFAARRIYQPGSGPILEKISAQGIHSLTERERQILEAARNKMAKR